MVFSGDWPWKTDITGIGTVMERNIHTYQFCHYKTSQ